MSTKYEYIKSPVDIGSLSYDILDESGIITTLLYCNFDGPNILEIYFESDISVDEKTLLDGIVTNHDGVQLSEPAVLPTGDLPEDMVTVTDGEGMTYWLNISDLIYNVLNANEYETAVEDASSTTSTSWQRKLRLILSGLKAGKYKIDWYYEWAYSNSNSQFKSRLQVDDTDTYMEQEVRSAQASTSKYRGTSGFVYVNLTSGDHTVDLDYCSSRNKKAAYIRRARVSVRRVS